MQPVQVLSDATLEALSDADRNRKEPLSPEGLQVYRSAYTVVKETGAVIRTSL